MKCMKALIAVVVVFALFAVPASGAGAQEATGRIGTIDTRRLATDLNWSREMDANIKRISEEIQTNARQIELLYDAQVQQKKKEFGIKGDETVEQLNKMLTEAQKTEMIGMINLARQNLTSFQQQANQAMQKYVNEWDKQYSDAIRPLVRQIAESRKLSVVINLSSTPVMYSDPAVDVTDAVVDAAKKQPPKFIPVDVPKITIPGDIGTLSKLPTSQPATKIAPPVTPVIPPKGR